MNNCFSVTSKNIPAIPLSRTEFSICPYDCFIFFNSLAAKITASAAAAASAIGPAYITPSIPINNGKIKISGSRKSTCLVRDITIPSFAFPIEVKNPEDIGWIPFANVINMKIFKYRSAK